MSARRLRAAAGSLLFLIAVPGVVAGVVPYALTGWRTPSNVPLPAQVGGAGLVICGVLVLVYAFVQFVWEGRGTPAPVAPTEQLVVHGPYRWVRNPMYLAVAAIIGGQAIVLSSGEVALWLVAFLVAVWVFVTTYEQPTLRSRYGSAYETYQRAVPGWRPRLRPWRGPGSY
jgi:protein-S-isoprenylcysteine O-methyltransferase Ste14